ncbi:hypothetical protein ACX0G7_11655 [Flavitalea antarctica]
MSGRNKYSNSRQNTQKQISSFHFSYVNQSSLELPYSAINTWLLLIVIQHGLQRND